MCLKSLINIVLSANTLIFYVHEYISCQQWLCSISQKHFLLRLHPPYLQLTEMQLSQPAHPQLPQHQNKVHSHVHLEPLETACWSMTICMDAACRSQIKYISFWSFFKYELFWSFCLKGARYIMAAEEKTATTSVTSALSSSFGGIQSFLWKPRQNLFSSHFS